MPQPAAGDATACPGRGGRFGSVLRIAPVILLLGAVTYAYWRGWIPALDLETLADLYGRFHSMIEAHPAQAVAFYTLAYVLVGALCVPGGALLTAAGGLAFGTLLATTATVVGATAGATLLFLVARNACGDWLKRRQSDWVQKLRAGFEEDAFHYLLFLRLVPAFPFWFVNVAAAVLGLPLRTFLTATFIGIIPATLAYASAGAGLGHVIAAARAKHEACLAAGPAALCKMTIPANAIFSRDLVLALVLLGLIALVPVLIKKWRRSNV